MSDQTEGKIDDIIKGSDISPNTKFVLVSSVYLKGKWKNPFSPRLTKKRNFNLAGRTVSFCGYHIADNEIHLPVLDKIKLEWLSRFKIDLLFKPMIILFFSLQFVSSFYAFYKDVKYKFTLSHDAADFIKLNNLDKDHQLVGYIDYAAQHRCYWLNIQYLKLYHLH